MQMTSFTLSGPISTDATVVSIRCTVDATKLPSFHIKGASLEPNQAKEIAVRVRSAMMSANLAWPAGHVVISLDAGGAKLQSPPLDLPIALAIAGVDVDGLLVAGELGLDGSVRAVRGALAAAALAKSLGLRGVLIAASNAREVTEALGPDLAVYAISHLVEVDSVLAAPVADLPKRAISPRAVIDFADVRGQSEALAAVEQSAQTHAGLLLSGPPGAGKTMIARRIPSVLPRMRRDEQLAVTRIYSAIGLADGLVAERPFRAPHHTISAAALAGGGTSRRPGEVHLASHGVLFLDEVQEFSRGAIETLAQALREMPAASRPLVVASANPCPCGWRGATTRACTCTEETVTRYTARVTWAASKLGLTINASVEALALSDLRAVAGESSRLMAARIAATVGAQ